MLQRIAPLAVLALLAACTTPQEACIYQAREELRSLQGRIATAQGNLDRGYAIHRQVVPYTYVVICHDDAGKAYQCEQNATRIEETPVAIDIREERAKLARLRAALPGAQRAAEARIAQCRATYPE